MILLMYTSPFFASRLLAIVLMVGFYAYADAAAENSTDSDQPRLVEGGFHVSQMRTSPKINDAMLGFVISKFARLARINGEISIRDGFGKEVNDPKVLKLFLEKGFVSPPHTISVQNEWGVWGSDTLEVVAENAKVYLVGRVGRDIQKLDVSAIVISK